MALTVKGYDNGTYMEITYVAAEDLSGSVVVIDPGCFIPEIESAIDNSNGLAYIFLTHGHPDHIREIMTFKEKYPEAVVVGSMAERPMFTDDRINHVSRLTGKKVEFEADKYVKDGDIITLGDTEFKFIETPGHTPGGMCILADNIIFSGDTLFAGDMGRTDLWGGDFDALRASITDKLFKLPDDIVVYPGHGSSTTIGKEKSHNLILSMI